MKKIFLLPLLGALVIFSACEKQQSDADRQAEIDRQVQQKLDAEHQAQQREDLARREGELNAREQALAQNSPNESREPETRAQDRHVEDRQSDRGGDYALFYSKLEPHGDWMETSQYGYVFHPREAESSSWRPYTNGRWVYSDAGWTWVSEEPFGWATYHYGRWMRLRSVGWVWIPGDEWAPAWVSWRKSDNYVGWAPLPPEARFDHGAGIHNWADNYYDIGPENYSFIETREFGAQRIDRAIVPAQQNVTIVNQTTNVTNITYNNTTVINQGPSFDEIRARSAQPVQRVKLERDVNVNISVGDPRAVVRADALVVSAPVIQPARVVEKPKVVKKTITNIEVERGWDEVKDRHAAEQARAKVRSESTPPANPPAKTFVRPNQAGAPAARSTSTVAPSPNESATVAESKATPFQAPSSRVTPTPHATVAPTATPQRNDSPELRRPQFMPNRKLPPRPSPSASATAAAETVPTATASPSSTTSGDAEPRRNSFREQRKNLPPNKQDRQERLRERREDARSLTSPSASPSTTATPAGM